MKRDKNFLDAEERIYRTRLNKLAKVDPETASELYVSRESARQKWAEEHRGW